MVGLTAEPPSPVRTGAAWLSLALLALFRKIPRGLFEKIELPRMLLPVPESTSTPLIPLKAMVLPAPEAVPPMVLLLLAPLKIATPFKPLPSATVPVLSVPMRLPWMRLSVELLRKKKLSRIMPRRPLPEITLPAPGSVPPMVLPDTPSSVIPSLLGTARVPLESVPM